MKRSIVVGPLASLLALAAFAALQACSSDESSSGSTSASSGSTSSSTTSSSGSTSSGASNSSSSSSGSTTGDTCTPAGGTCVCGPTTLACPSSSMVRDGSKKCVQGPQGSGACYTTCCVPGDGGAVPPVDAGSDADSGS